MATPHRDLNTVLKLADRKPDRTEGIRIFRWHIATLQRSSDAGRHGPGKMLKKPGRLGYTRHVRSLSSGRTKAVIAPTFFFQLIHKLDRLIQTGHNNELRYFVSGPHIVILPAVIVQSNEDLATI